MIQTYTISSYAQDALLATSRFDKETLYRIHCIAEKMQNNEFDRAYLQRQYVAIRKTGNFFAKMACGNYTERLETICTLYIQLKKPIVENLKKQLLDKVKLYQSGLLAFSEILEIFQNFAWEYNPFIRDEIRTDFITFKTNFGSQN